MWGCGVTIMGGSPYWEPLFKDIGEDIGNLRKCPHCGVYSVFVGSVCPDCGGFVAESAEPAKSVEIDKRLDHKPTDVRPYPRSK